MSTPLFTIVHVIRFENLPTWDDLAQRIERMEKLMATFQDEIAKLTDAVNGANDRTTATNAQVTDLQKQVDDLKAKLDSAELTPDQQAALDAVVDSVNQIDVTPPPPPPAVSARP